MQIYAWNELNPLDLDTGFLKQIKQTAHGCNQEVTALCGELGGHGLEIAKDNKEKIKYLKATIDCAKELETRIVTTHIGRIPEDETSERYRAMFEACMEIGEYAKKSGAIIAVETGPEPVERLVDFCRKCEGIAINYDPANLVMVTKDDEVKGVELANDLIVHTHAKDGIMKKYLGPEKTYEVFASGGIEAINDLLQIYFSETPLGQGDVRFKQYIAALKSINYTGYLTIEREVQKDASNDIYLAVEYLKNII